MKIWPKIKTLIGIGIVSWLCSTVGFMTVGVKVAEILNPDECGYIDIYVPPVMTIPQTWIYTAIFALIMLAIIWLIIRSLRLSQKHKLIAFCVLSVLNLFFMIMLAPYLYTQLN